MTPNVYARAALAAALVLFAAPAAASVARFQHIVLIVQENRTPDNLFFAMCGRVRCDTSPGAHAYDIQTANWLDRGRTVAPLPAPLAGGYDLRHAHADFVAMCDSAPGFGCRMDGAGNVRCAPGSICPLNSQFRYVDNSNGILEPYFKIAMRYGWANFMFQTNQGPSFPAHQFLFGATSAPDKVDDHLGTFASENLHGFVNGCLAGASSAIQLIDAQGVENRDNTIYPCFEHKTLADLLAARLVSWRYYTSGAGSLWTAPDAIAHICRPRLGSCTGPLWAHHLDLIPSDVFRDIRSCSLRSVSWVIPSAENSDHARGNRGGGPGWVASIVNAIGESPCRNPDNSSYWDSTAIVVTWDDWGGWYDHEPPEILPYPEGGYQYGFRVPMLFVSAYTPAGFIDNRRLDFGSIIRFVEHNFGIRMGKLSFSDARSTTNLAEYFDLGQTPRAFVPIASTRSATDFMNDKTPPSPPDDE